MATTPRRLQAPGFSPDVKEGEAEREQSTTPRRLEPPPFMRKEELASLGSSIPANAFLPEEPRKELGSLNSDDLPLTAFLPGTPDAPSESASDTLDEILPDDGIPDEMTNEEFEALFPRAGFLPDDVEELTNEQLALFDFRETSEEEVAEIAKQKIRTNDLSLTKFEYKIFRKVQAEREFLDRSGAFFEQAKAMAGHVIDDAFLATAAVADAMYFPFATPEIVRARKDPNKRTTVAQAMASAGNAMAMWPSQLGAIARNTMDSVSGWALEEMFNVDKPLTSLWLQEDKRGGFEFDTDTEIELEYQRILRNMGRWHELPQEGEGTLVGAATLTVASALGASLGVQLEAKEKMDAAVVEPLSNTLTFAPDFILPMGAAKAALSFRALRPSAVSRSVVNSAGAATAREAGEIPMATASFPWTLRAGQRFDAWARGTATPAIDRGIAGLGRTPQSIMTGAAGAVLSGGSPGAAVLGAALPYAARVTLYMGFGALKWTGRASREAATPFARALKAKHEFGLAGPQNAGMWARVAADTTAPAWARSTAGISNRMLSNPKMRQIIGDTKSAAFAGTVGGFTEGFQEAFEEAVQTGSTPESIGGGFGAGFVVGKGFGWLASAIHAPKDVDGLMMDMDALHFRQRMIQRGDDTHYYDNVLTQEDRRNIAAAQAAAIDSADVRLVTDTVFSAEIGRPGVKWMAEGVYRDSNGQILINTDLVKPNRIARVVAHEIGHASFARLPADLKDQWQVIADRTYGKDIIEQYRQDLQNDRADLQEVSMDIVYDELYAEHFLGVNSTGRKLLDKKRKISGDFGRTMRRINSSVLAMMGIEGGVTTGTDARGRMLFDFTPYKADPAVEGFIHQTLRDLGGKHKPPPLPPPATTPTHQRIPGRRRPLPRPADGPPAGSPPASDSGGAPETQAQPQPETQAQPQPETQAQPAREPSDPETAPDATLTEEEAAVVDEATRSTNGPGSVIEIGNGKHVVLLGQKPDGTLDTMDLDLFEQAIRDLPPDGARSHRARVAAALEQATSGTRDRDPLLADLVEALTARGQPLRLDTPEARERRAAAERERQAAAAAERERQAAAAAERERQAAVAAERERQAAPEEATEPSRLQRFRERQKTLLDESIERERGTRRERQERELQRQQRSGSQLGDEELSSLFETLNQSAESQPLSAEQREAQRRREELDRFREEADKPFQPLGLEKPQIPSIVENAQPSQLKGARRPGDDRYAPHHRTVDPSAVRSIAGRALSETEGTNDSPAARAYAELDAIKRAAPILSARNARKAWLAIKGRDGGAEHKVLLEPGNGWVTKVWDTHENRGLDTPFDYLRRIGLQNALFGDNIQVLGVYGGTGIVTRQPFYDAADPNASLYISQPEIQEYMADRGFRVVEGTDGRTLGEPSSSVTASLGTIEYSNGRITVADARPDNFVRKADGELQLIDALIYEWVQFLDDFPENAETWVAIQPRSHNFSEIADQTQSPLGSSLADSSQEPLANTPELGTLGDASLRLSPPARPKGAADPGGTPGLLQEDRTEAGRLPGRGRVAGSEGGVSAPHRPYPPSNEQPFANLASTVIVDGRRVEFGPLPVAREAARSYMQQAGLPYSPPTEYARVDQERATRIADEFQRMEHAPNDPEVRAAYRAMIDETLGQYEAIKGTGLVIEPIPLGTDPYGNPRNAILDVVENNHLWFFPTREGFGGPSSVGVDISGNPLLEPTGEVINGHPMVANDVFRVVHDYFGHIKEGVGFRADGEENAWRSHSSMYSDLARRAMTTETRGQNSWVNFGPFGEKNRTANGGDTEYAPQKIGLLPEWVVEEGRFTVSSSAPLGEPVPSTSDLGASLGDVPPGTISPNTGDRFAPVDPTKRKVFQNLTDQQKENLAANIDRFGWVPEEEGMTRQEFEALIAPSRARGLKRGEVRRRQEEVNAQILEEAQSAPPEISRASKTELDRSAGLTDDGYYYHIAPRAAVPVILKSQEIVSSREQSMAPGFYADYSKGKVFLTDRSGIEFWNNRIQEHLESQGRPTGTVVLRVPKTAVPKAEADTVGTQDANAPSWFIPTGTLKPVSAIGDRFAPAQSLLANSLNRAIVEGAETTPETRQEAQPGRALGKESDLGTAILREGEPGDIGLARGSRPPARSAPEFRQALNGPQIEAKIAKEFQDDPALGRNLASRVDSLLAFQPAGSGDLTLIGAGGEALVFAKPDSDHVVKAIYGKEGIGQFGFTVNGKGELVPATLDQTFERLRLFEEAFDSGIKVESLLDDNRALIITQTAYEGAPPSDPELVNFMENDGWTAVEGVPLQWRKGDVLASDVKPSNAVKLADGTVQPIDFVMTRAARPRQ